MIVFATQSYNQTSRFKRCIYSNAYVSNENEKELVCEVLNTTPGSIYSTGILFPRKDNQSLLMSDLKYEMNDDENIGDENLSDEDSDEQGDDMRDLGNQEEDEDINSLILLYLTLFSCSIDSYRECI